jgi:hypothetical protein
LRNSGGTSGGIVNVHISVIRINDENIEQDVIEPQRGKIARVAKKYEPDYMVYRLEKDPTNIQENVVLGC